MLFVELSLNKVCIYKKKCSFGPGEHFDVQKPDWWLQRSHDTGVLYLRRRCQVLPHHGQHYHRQQEYGHQNGNGIII